jgi:hypothetical protein
VEAGAADVAGAADDEDVAALLLNRPPLAGAEVVGVAAGFAPPKREAPVLVLGAWVAGVEELLAAELPNKPPLAGAAEVAGLAPPPKRPPDAGALLKRLGPDVAVAAG